jgi:DNA primase
MSQSHQWVDFKELRHGLRFPDVLAYYKVQLKPKGERATGFCPLPTHQGKRRSPSFSVNLARSIWQCFGCHAKGNVLDFCCRMEGLNPDLPNELRKAALKIRDVFLPGGASERRDELIPDHQRTLINPPIDFELKTLDPNHPYLKERGFTESTIRHFGLGFCNRGMLRGRIAIPLHSLEGELVGYAGRLTKVSEISERNPKYLFPGERVKDDVKIEFRKSHLLYNAHRIAAPVDHLFVVEGFMSTFWLCQAEYVNTVALMGSHCSKEQGEIIVDLVKPDGKVWLIPDGNEAGRLCALSAFEQIAPYRSVRWVRLEKDEQPTDVSAEELPAVII